MVEPNDLPVGDLWTNENKRPIGELIEEANRNLLERKFYCFIMDKTAIENWRKSEISIVT
jgi:hypothetical protein